jgi:hypothetical protein
MPPILPPLSQQPLKMAFSDRDSIKRTQTRKQIISDTVKIVVLFILSWIVERYLVGVEGFQELMMLAVIGWIVAEMAECLDIL